MSETQDKNLVEQEPKKLIVPEMTKKDVEQIAQDSISEELVAQIVYDAIADGKIVIPEGGAKIYRHVITGIPDGNILTVYSLSSAKVTDVDSFNDLLSTCLQAIIGDPTSAEGLMNVVNTRFYFSEDSGDIEPTCVIKVFYNDGSPTNNVANIIEGYSPDYTFTDTVTEL